jgi:Protein of unknown function (DUF2695)
MTSIKTIREHNDSTDLDVLLPKNSIGRRCEVESEVLSPKSTRWRLFADALSIVLEDRGCSTSRVQKLRPELPHAGARAVLNQMEDVDINRTLVFFEEHGGYCECEILLNVDLGEERDYDAAGVENEDPEDQEEDAAGDEDDDLEFVDGAKELADKALMSLKWLPVLSETHPELLQADDGSAAADRIH